jgi:hypothetical protein
MFSGQQFDEALQFTEKEINSLKESKKIRFMVGAGIQSDIDQDLGTALLGSASKINKPTGLSLVSLINRYLSLSSSEDTKVKLSEVIQKMRRIEENNALSYYLYAAILQRDNKHGGAIKQLSIGNSKNIFNSYSTERYNTVVEAAESLGYFKFTSRQYAYNFFIPGEIYLELIDLCDSLVNNNASESSRKECFEMGTKIVLASQNTSEKLQGLMIQGVALRDSPNPKDVEALKDVSNKQRITAQKGSSLLKIPFKEIPENVWIQYHDMFFRDGEEAALAFLENFYEKQQN